MIMDFEDRCEVHYIHEDNVREVKTAMLEQETIFSLAELFKTMGDATRLKLIFALMKKELCVCDLAAVIGVSESAVSHQLRVLRNQKLVKFRRQGKVMYYTLADEHVRMLFAQGLEHVCE